MIWKCRDKELEYGKRVLIMGIVNITPDSFSDGGKWFNPNSAVERSLSLIADGADIIDLGAQSTRPNYSEVDEIEEWQRLKPVLKKLREITDKPISVDTYFPFVAKNALEAGADIINDVSGEMNPLIAKEVSSCGAGWVVMHNGEGSVNEVKDFFDYAVSEAEKLGVKKEQLCLDMGIGFGKSYEENLELISNVEKYKKDGLPLLIAFSRKRVIGKASGQDIPEKRIWGNIAADTAAVLGGADIIRVHEVKGEIEGIRTAEELKRVWIK